MAYCGQMNYPRYDLWKTVSEHLKDVAYKWHTVDKWITQGSLSGPHLFNLFINDLAIRDNELTSIVKYADDTTLPVKVCKNELKTIDYRFISNYNISATNTRGVVVQNSCLITFNNYWSRMIMSQHDTTSRHLDFRQKTESFVTVYCTW